VYVIFLSSSPFKMILCSKLHKEELVLCTYLIFIVKDVQGVRTCSANGTSKERIKQIAFALQESFLVRRPITVAET
jgi:hypothetical protein